MVLANGRFAPGESGNPGGRKKEIEGLALAIRSELEKNAASGGVNEAVLKTLEIMRTADEPRDQLAAIKVLLEYGYGKPSQEIQHQVSESLSSLFDAMKAEQE